MEYKFLKLFLFTRDYFCLKRGVNEIKTIYILCKNIRLLFLIRFRLNRKSYIIIIYGNLTNNNENKSLYYTLNTLINKQTQKLQKKKLHFSKNSFNKFFSFI